MRFIFKKLITKVKPNINSVEVHPQLSNNRHPVDGVLVGAGSLWRIISPQNHPMFPCLVGELGFSK
jgi:hypothetical protein